MKSFKRMAVATAALLVAISMPTWASDITGQVVLPGGHPAAEAIVYFDGGGTAQPLPTASVDQRNKTFIPHVSVVTIGTVVRFPNDDSVFHNVFAYYDAKKFDLGMYPRGASKSVTFDKPGLVALLCNIHSDMSAYIMVVDTPYYAVTDGRGRFHIENVPNGSYTLHGWQESGARVTRTIDIQSDQPSLIVALRK
jgi:plastocyanin